MTAGASPRDALAFAVVTLIWGSTWLVIKDQIGDVSAPWSVAYRFAIAGAVMVIACHALGRWRRPTLAAHGFAALAGAMQFAANFNLVYAAEATLTSGLVALVFALLIVPNAVFARLALGTPITRRFVAGSAVGVAGLVLVFAPDLVAGRDAIAAGIALSIAAVLCASVGNVMQASPIGRSLPTMPTLALAMLYGAAIDAAFAWIVTGPPVFSPRPMYWLGLAYLAVVATVVAFTFYFDLIRRIGPGPAAYTSVVTPVVAMALSTWFEAYRWTPAAAAGSVLALAGLVIALGRRS